MEPFGISPCDSRFSPPQTYLADIHGPSLRRRIAWPTPPWPGVRSVPRRGRFSPDIAAVSPAIHGATTLAMCRPALPSIPGRLGTQLMPMGHQLIACAYPPGLNPMVRRVVTGDPTGWKRQRLTADRASRSKVRGGFERTTRALLTEPSRLTVNSTCTSPDSPARSALAGYCGAGVLTARSSLLGGAGVGVVGAAGCAAACCAARCWAALCSAAR